MLLLEHGKVKVVSVVTLLKWTVSWDFRVFVFCIKLLLLVPLKVLWDDFDFCQTFAEIFNKKSAQRCMIYRETVTSRCIIHHGMVTLRCIYSRQKTKPSHGTSKGTRRSYLMQKTNTQKSRDTVPLKYSIPNYTNNSLFFFLQWLQWPTVTT